MKSLFSIVASAAVLLSGNAFAGSSDTKVALVPGGPHPYFAAWERAGQDAVKDFGLGKADYKVPAEWDLSQQNELIESLVGKGYNAVLVFPGDAVGTNKILGELDDAGIPTAALAGCVEQPTKAKMCFGTDTGHSAYLGTKQLIDAMGGKGKIDVSRFKGLGEMDAKDLKDTTMNPATRKLIRVTIDEDEPGETGDLVERLMGKKPEKRFEYIQENAQFVEELDV